MRKFIGLLSFALTGHAAFAQPLSHCEQLIRVRQSTLWQATAPEDKKSALLCSSFPNEVLPCLNEECAFGKGTRDQNCADIMQRCCLSPDSDRFNCPDLKIFPSTANLTCRWETGSPQVLGPTNNLLEPADHSTLLTTLSYEMGYNQEVAENKIAHWRSLNRRLSNTCHGKLVCSNGHVNVTSEPQEVTCLADGKAGCPLRTAADCLIQSEILGIGVATIHQTAVYDEPTEIGIGE